MAVLEKVEVEYATFPGWLCDITVPDWFVPRSHAQQIRSYAELPAAAQQYIAAIESLVGVAGVARAQSLLPL